MSKKLSVEHPSLLIVYCSHQQLKTYESLTSGKPQLHQQLMQAALDSGVKVNSGLKVESADVANTTILLANGSKISADLIIAADGLHVGDISPTINDLVNREISLVCHQTICSR